jgi:ABC-2 type transport system ATP-binding protein
MGMPEVDVGITPGWGGTTRMAADMDREEFLELFELAARGDELIESYSHGMRQKLVMCAALLHQPRVLVVDEPMVGLDPQHARVVKDLLKERAQAGMAVLLSTHQLSVAEEMADRIGIMNAGRLIALGSREELRRESGEAGPLEDVFLTLTKNPQTNGETRTPHD